VSPSRSYRAPLALGLTGVLVVAWAMMALGAGRTAVEVGINHSRFEPEVLRLEAGQEVTFVITNDDPIDHEFILGDQAVQDRHELGTEAHHGAIPTEVSVPAGETVHTTVRFDRPGALILGCHLPGHYAYGMRATVVVG
jgi:uncharacterized cupredoxin-like copper-binding protein